MLYHGPKIFNIYKPVGCSSHDIVRHFKRNLPKGYGKIGHFGTLDPFAEGVLMVGVNGAARLNDYVHEFLPKTYLATGVLGISTETGDLTVEPNQKDETPYFLNEIPQFKVDFLEKKVRDQFLGDYQQAPHHFSAAKHEGKALHQWAREGVKIEKEKKLKTIYDLKIVEYNFPEVLFEVTVSSGTYIRTLFAEMAEHLGTCGTLKKLIRTKVGGATVKNALQEKNWPEKEKTWDIEENSLNLESLLPFESINLSAENAGYFKNGRFIASDLDSNKPYWIKDEDQNDLIGVGFVVENELRPKINFFKI